MSTNLYGAFNCFYHVTKPFQSESTIRLVWLNGWVFVYELSGCGFESRCSRLHLRYSACFEQRVSRHSDKYIVWNHSETRTWHDKSIRCFVQASDIEPEQTAPFSKGKKFERKRIVVSVILVVGVQLSFTCSKLTIEISEQGVRYVHSQQ